MPHPRAGSPGQYHRLFTPHVLQPHVLYLMSCSAHMGCPRLFCDKVPCDSLEPESGEKPAPFLWPHRHRKDSGLPDSLGSERDLPGVAASSVEGYRWAQVPPVCLWAGLPTMCSWSRLLALDPGIYAGSGDLCTCPMTQPHPGPGFLCPGRALCQSHGMQSPPRSQ